MKTWKYWYALAVDYYKEYGNLDIKAKQRYKGENLGGWINDQRKKYKNTYINIGKYRNTGKLTDNQTKLLEDIGMIWDKLDYEWNKYYSKCIEYKQINGNLIMPINTEFDSMKLRAWIGTQRNNFKKKKLRQDRINKFILNRNYTNMEKNTTK